MNNYLVINDKQIYGMAKGYKARLDCRFPNDHQIFIVVSDDINLIDLNDFNLNQELGLRPSYDNIVNLVVDYLKEFVMWMGREREIKKVPTEDELHKTAIVLVDDLNQARKRDLRLDALV